MTHSDDILRGTPYLIESDSISQEHFYKSAQRSVEFKEKARRQNERIQREATEALGPYLTATRTDLVAESNVIEGYDWTKEQVREVVLMNRELLDGSTRTLIDSVRSDRRVYEVLGLYKAHEVAEAWASNPRPPLAHEIRELHHIILGDTHISGAYKRFPNEIEGSPLRTAEPFDVPRLILDVADWWAAGSADPVLTATVVHAWLVHIHPFEDGNGRLARVLANLELARHGYPPLLVRAESDRGEYFAALAESDEGNILPLYELFVRLMRRQVTLMSTPGYVDALINDRFLASNRDRFRFWLATLEQFESVFTHALGVQGLDWRVHGRPTLESFSLLGTRNRDGNGWWITAGAHRQPHEWLLWFGYRSEVVGDLIGEQVLYPSLFVARRDHDPDAPHPYRPWLMLNELGANVPEEIALLPVRANGVCLKRGYDDLWLSVPAAADRIARALADEVH